MDFAHKPLRTYHFVSGLILGLFLCLHITNHIVGLAGQSQHIAFMELVRPIYRNVVIEPVLLLLFLTQIVTGGLMVLRGWRGRRGKISWVQAFSGLYLAVFLINHIAAVLGARWLLDLDTNFNFAAAGLHAGGWAYFFAPYYGLAVASLFVHLGCALYWNLGGQESLTAKRTFIILTATGIVLGIAMVLSMSGFFHLVSIPDAYLDIYGV